jgi:hypothetical protein
VEDLIAALFLFLVEVILPIIFELALHLFVNVPGAFSGFALIAMILGWFSTHLLPTLVFHRPLLGVLNLIVAPILAGYLARGIAARKKSHPRFPPQKIFWYAYGFALLFIAARAASLYVGIIY